MQNFKDIKHDVLNVLLRSSGQKYVDKVIDDATARFTKDAVPAAYQSLLQRTRNTTGVEIAELLKVTQSSFSRHSRGRSLGKTPDSHITRLADAGLNPDELGLGRPLLDRKIVDHAIAALKEMGQDVDYWVAILRTIETGDDGWVFGDRFETTIADFELDASDVWVVTNQLKWDRDPYWQKNIVFPGLKRGVRYRWCIPESLSVEAARLLSYQRQSTHVDSDQLQYFVITPGCLRVLLEHTPELVILDQHAAFEVDSDWHDDTDLLLPPKLAESRTEMIAELIDSACPLTAR